jgi:hypothetical protein
MSLELKPDAYKTKLGNPTAKNVLALIADQVNNEGLGWPSMEYIADRTEVNLRTVLRMVQVFAAIGLLTKTRMLRYGKEIPALQVNMALLGTDLREQFAAAYETAQKKKRCTGDESQPVSVECRRDSEPAAASDVAATGKGVAATSKSVAATIPPHPHKGGPLTDPLLTHPPSPQGGTVGGDCEPDPDFNEEQQAHLDRLSGGQREHWERYYRSENEREQRERLEAARRLREMAAEIAELQRAMPTVAAARDWVMRECGWVITGRGKGVEYVIELAIRQDGREPYRPASEMARSWKKFKAHHADMRFSYGPLKFIQLGLWHDERAWPWNQDKMRLESEASAGRVS